LGTKGQGRSARETSRVSAVGETLIVLVGAMSVLTSIHTFAATRGYSCFEWPKYYAVQTIGEENRSKSGQFMEKGSGPRADSSILHLSKGETRKEKKNKQKERRKR
jgi:hypothetical protein